MKKYAIVALVIVLILTVFIYSAKLFSPGSYPYAEKYELDVNELKLDSLIQDLKNRNPQFKVPDQIGLMDGRANRNDHWYHVYFYYHEENQIVYFWTRPEGKKKTTVALIGINEGLVLGHWKDINKDFSSSENEEQIKKFEERILNKIRDKIK